MANPFGDEEHTAGANPFGDAPDPIATPPVKTNLLSTEGLSSLGKTIIPSVQQGLEGMRLRRLETPEDDIINKPLVNFPGRGLPKTPGNIDLNNRPSVKNADGSVSTVRSMGIEQDGQHILVPTVSDDGRIMSPEEAIQQYNATGKHLGIFDNPEESNIYAKQLSKDQSELVESRNKIRGLQEEITANTPKNQSYPLELARGVTQSVAQNALPIAAGVAARKYVPPVVAATPAVLSGAYQQTGDVYAKDRVKTNKNPLGDEEVPISVADARGNAAVQGFAEGALSILPVGGLLKDLGKDTFLKTVGKFILREEATEIPTTIIQKISDRVFANPNQPMGEFLKEMGSQVVDTAISTPFAAGGTVALAKTQSAIQDTVFNRKEQDKAAALDGYKASIIADLQKASDAAAQGLEPTETMGEQMKRGDNHADIDENPLTPDEERAAKGQLFNLKVGASSAPVLPEAVMDVADLDHLLSDPTYQQPDETKAKVEESIAYDMDRGMSREVAERRASELYPNRVPPSQRPVVWSTDVGQVGLSLSQAKIAPGAVAIIGGNDEQFSPAYIKALGDTISKWAKIIMPEHSRIILNLSGLTGEAVGGYQQNRTGIHIITPRELVRTQRAEVNTRGGVTLGTEPGTGYNTFTQQQTFGAITHEFGHALTMAAFGQAMPSKYKNIVSALDAGGRYSDEQIAEMPALEGAVVRDYQAMKARVIDGTMSAEELTDKWLGTWKLGKDLLKTQDRTLYRHAKEVLLREAKRTGDSSLSSLPLNQIPALTLIHAMGRNRNVSEQQSNAEAENYYLQFNEYMAEQFSRYAHANKIDQGTALGVYFKRALDTLRAFFKALKSGTGVGGDTVIKPGVSFQEWVDSMGMAKALRMAEAVQRKPKTRTPRATKIKDIEDITKQVVAEVKAEEDGVEEGNSAFTLESLAEDPVAKELAREQIRQAFPDPKDKTRAELMHLVGVGRLVEAMDQLDDITKTQVMKDVKEAGGAWAPESVHELTQGIPQTPLEHNGWMHKAVMRYMQKWMGTTNDPIKNIEVPIGLGTDTWEAVTDELVRANINYIEYTHPADKFYQGLRVGETYYDIEHYKNGTEVRAARGFINHVFDYMREFVPANKLGQYDFVRAAKETVAQDARQAKKMATTEGQLEGTTVYKKYPDGMMWVKVESESALKNEGDAMGHCVGGYCEMVHNGESEIYSLRDAMGRPHVTIEVTPERGTPPDPNAGEFDQVQYYARPDINQIKGKQNLAPVAAYLPHVQDFVRTGPWQYVSDLANAGLATTRDILPAYEKDYMSWLAHVHSVLGDQQYYPIKELYDTYSAYVLANKPRLDKDIAEEKEVVNTLARIGVKDTSLWTKAMNFVKSWQNAVLQLQQISHSSDDQGLQSFVLQQNKLMAMKNNLLKDGTTIAQKWEKLSRADATAIEKVLTDEFHSGGHVTELIRDVNTGAWSHIGGVAFLDYLKTRGIDGTTEHGQELAQLILDVKNSLLQHVQSVEDMAIQIIKDKYSKADLVMKMRANQIRDLAHKWRAVPFLPQGHYGNYVVKVYEKNAEGKRTLAYQGHFETAAEQDAAVKKLQKTVGPKDLKWMKLPEAVGVQLTIPKDFLETLEDTEEFTSEQLATIGEAMTPLRDERAFSKFARDASKVAGASPDVLRNYVNWIEDNANFVSKLTYGRAMTKSRAWTRSDMNELKRAGNIAGAREKQVLLDTMGKAQQFIMHPLDEFFKTRSVVSLTYLMYAPKTALMNATGLFQTWAAMTADYGEFMGNKLMAGATKDLMTGKLTADEHWMKNRALEDGIIDQGFGYFMSGLANAGNLQRRIRPTLAGRAARGFVDLGMYPFKAVETANRNLTMLSIYRAERTRLIGQGRNVKDAQQVAYDSAARKTRLLQNDYASGNRPEILRGKKSIFMIFLSYPQYMLWIMSGGYERGTRQESRLRGETPRSAWGGMTMRMWLIFLALAGTEGVPFGDTIQELLQRLWKMFGKGENVKVEGQKFLKDTVGIESAYWRQVVQRGFLHDVLGVDLSGSYSLGKPIPGLGLINPQADNWKEFVGEAFGELSGPFGGFVKGAATLGLSDAVDPRELGRSIPGAGGALARAVDAAQNGVKSSRGERILRDEKGNLREPTAAEIALLGTGFRLAEVARFQEVEALKRQQADYWNGRRIGLKKQYKIAYESQDPMLRADVDKAIADYNGDIPDRGLRLTGKELREYRVNNARAVRRLERDQDPARVRGLHQDISETMGQ